MTSASVFTGAIAQSLLNCHVTAAASPARKYVQTASVAGNQRTTCCLVPPVRVCPTLLLSAVPARATRELALEVMLVTPIATANRPPNAPANEVAIFTSSGSGSLGVGGAAHICLIQRP